MCIRNIWDAICGWIRKIFDNTPDGMPRQEQEEKKEETEDKEE